MESKVKFGLSSSEFKPNESKTEEFNKKALWVNICLMTVAGLQISIYYTSIWPYLKEISIGVNEVRVWQAQREVYFLEGTEKLDPSVSIDFLGWVIAAASIGQSIASPAFGYWNQKTHSVIQPVSAGFSVAIIGQVIYLLLPWFPSKSSRWIMLGARCLTGMGTGALSVLRTYLSLSSPPELKMRYISYGTGFLVIGITAGPGLQSLFSPFGEDGIRFAGINWNMYSLPTVSMILLLLLSIYVIRFHFGDDTSRFVYNSSENEFQVLPKFDKTSAIICIFCWTVCCLIATIFEVISTPLSIAMYNWTNSEAILYNGIFVMCSCVVSVTFYFLFGLTKLGEFDKRKMILTGLIMFMIYLLIDYPWFFYDGPLTFIPENATTREVGGCERSYDWCASTVRVPMIPYLISFFINGIGFPFICAPGASLFSLILGPRRQGTMQGLYQTSGSMTQFIAPILATMLYEASGYKYVVLIQLIIAFTATLSVVLFYQRLRPLQMKPKLGKSASYKNGIFYVL